MILDAWVSRLRAMSQIIAQSFEQKTSFFAAVRRAMLMDFDHGVDAARVRSQKLQELLFLTPWMMLANMANTTIIMLATWKVAPSPVLIWGATIWCLSAKALYGCYKINQKPVRKSGSGRAVVRAVWHAGILGLLWGFLPVIILPYGGVVEQILATAVIAGMSAGGVFALASIPAAAMAYLVLMLIPALVAFAMGFIPASASILALGIIYFFTLCLTIFARYREFSIRVRYRHRLEQQSSTISLLLKDFETSASDWLWETDRVGYLTYVSDRLVQVTGMQRDDLLGLSIAVTGGDAKASVEWRHFVEQIQKGLPVRDCIVPAVHNGRHFWWSMTAGSSIMVDGQALGYRGVGTDITERKLAEVALEEKNKLLANFNAKLEQQVAARTEEAQRAEMAATEASRAKSIFLANMSHEIRSPMNGVFGMTDLLMRTDLDVRQQRLVSSICQSATNLLTVINDILDISRIEAGKLDIDRHEFDLRHCVEGAVDLFAEAAQRKGLDYSFFVTTDTPAVVWGDKGRLRQVFVNLIGNAIKFTESGEVAVRIGVETAKDGKVTIVCSVRDTGIGIAPDVLAKLFTPFAQADSSITRRFGGTGLGLSISRHLVELMGGQLQTQSTIRVGTEISFALTLDVGDLSKSTWVSPRILKPNTKVLVIDDRETNREILTHYLTAAGAETLAVSSAKEGLAALEQARSMGHPFAAAVVDVVMPEMTGVGFLEAVAANERIAGLKTVLVTSMSWTGDIAEVRRLGGHALLTKPVREAELIATVSSALGVPVRNNLESAANISKRRARDIAIKARVLVAEDNPINIEVASELLSAFGCEVRVAKDGLEAVMLFKSETFDVILMDCQMPGMDGPAATRHIRTREREAGLRSIPIIAVTAHAYDEDRRACLAAGMDDYLSKPYSETQLKEMLCRWVAPDQVSRLTIGLDAELAARAPPAPAIKATLGLSTFTAGEMSAALRDGLDAVLDRTQFQDFVCQFGEDTVPELVNIFLADCEVNLTLLSQIAETRNSEALQRLAHKIAGGASTMCALRLAQLARSVLASSKSETGWALTEIENLREAIGTTAHQMKILTTPQAVGEYVAAVA